MKRSSSVRLRLPPPKLAKGKSFPESLRRRKTTREIGSKPLTLQTLSNLLWAACGVNRTKGPFQTPGVTAASASNSQEIELYVALADGVYRFNAHRHELARIVSGDLRAFGLGERQPNVAKEAPVQLIYVVNLHKLTHTTGFEEPGLHDAEIQKSYYFVDTGIIAGNVYLFAASQGLACWFHNCNKTALTTALSLRPDQRVLFGQTVGYPAKKARVPRP
ncbi:MAG TPA: nitroreductase family protein [Polyangiaceae bacterium]|nr:nitroreductase family protein [Polyangiaceae bacterium]